MLPLNMVKTSIGKKVVMAVTGFMLTGFVIGHLAGNLLIFLGPGTLNAYAEKLVHLSALTWAVRIILLFAAILHIGMAVLLAAENKSARPIEYECRRAIQTSFAARTMVISGLALFAFIVFHLLHFTFRVTHPAISHLLDSEGRRDVFSMVVLSFQQVSLSLAYCAAMALLCLHLMHGSSSWLQSLGFNNEKTLKLFKKLGLIFAVALAAGYISIPISVLSGTIQLHPVG